MKLKWLEGLLTLFPILWAKTVRLTGPPTGESEVAPSRTFKCNLKSDRKGRRLNVRTDAAEFTWLSEHTRGVAMQKVEYRNGNYCAIEESPVKSTVDVKTISNNVAELGSLRPEIKNRLQHGQGCFTLVTARLHENKLHKENEMIVEGDGKGAWRIREVK